jgi:hypothetical protein
VAATTFATISAPTMIGFSENHQSRLIKIEIAGTNGRYRFAKRFSVEIFDASFANADSVF